MDLFAKKALIKGLREKDIDVVDIVAFHYTNASTPHSSFICKIRRVDYFVYINCMFNYPQSDIISLLEKGIERELIVFDEDKEYSHSFKDLCEYLLEDKLRLEQKIGFSFSPGLYTFVDDFFIDTNNDVIDFLKKIEGIDTRNFFVRN